MIEFRVSAGRPPLDPASRDCAALLTLLGGYAGVCSFPAIVAGLFVGPHILFAGIVCLAVVLLAVGLIWGLDRRAAAARWGTRVFAAAVAGLAGTAVVAAREDGPGGMIFWGVVVAAAVTLLVRSAWLPTEPRE